MKLDLGSGPTPHEGFVGVDKYDAGPDGVLCDLAVFPWPWADDSVDEVWSSHFIEHLPRELFYPFADELFRVLKPGAVATITHPNLKSVRAFQDMTHQNFIPAEAWWYLNKAWRVANELDRAPYPTCDFELVGQNWYGMHPDYLTRHDVAKQSAVTHMWEAAADVQVTLRKA